MPLRAGEKTAAGEGKAGGFPHAGKTGQIPPQEGLQIAWLKHPPCASPNGRSLRLDAHDLVRQKEPMADLITNSKSYQDLLAGLKNQILTAQVRAAVAVNQELVLLYWHIGKEILSRQTEEGWGAKII